jgi:hypothetical protein
VEEQPQPSREQFGRHASTARSTGKIDEFRPENATIAASSGLSSMGLVPTFLYGL